MKKNEDGIGTFFRKMQGSYIVMAVAYVVFGLSLLVKPEYQQLLYVMQSVRYVSFMQLQILSNILQAA